MAGTRLCPDACHRWRNAVSSYMPTPLLGRLCRRRGAPPTEARSRRLFRSIHPFPARMAPEIVLRALRRDDGRKRVLDPMAGSGTTVVSARMRGYRAYGIDSDPLAVMITSAASSDFNEKRFRSD